MPLEIVWSPLARARLQEIRAYVASDKPDAAERRATRIVALAEALKEYPYLGRAGSEPGVRELVVGGTPYLIFYRVRAMRVTIMTIWHGAAVQKETTKVTLTIVRLELCLRCLRDSVWYQFCLIRAPTDDRGFRVSWEPLVRSGLCLACSAEGETPSGQSAGCRRYRHPLYWLKSTTLAEGGHRL